MQKRVFLRIATGLINDTRALAARIDNDTSQLIRDAIRLAVEEYEGTGKRPDCLNGLPWVSEQGRFSILINEDRLQRAKQMAKECNVTFTYFVQSVVDDYVEKTNRDQERKEKRRQKK